jgi:hypothetical protein
MKTYKCVCGQLIFFRNISCVNCKRQLGFLPDALVMSSLDAESDGLWKPTRIPKVQTPLYRKCQNYWKESVCNWMVPKEESDPFCIACRLNETIPDLSQPENRALWAAAEGAKRGVVYSLLSLGLPVESKKAHGASGLAFRFLADVQNNDGTVSRTLTGHSDGTITLNIDEADDIHRETVRRKMKEPYRTLLGHFRHEVGHYYWDRLVRGTDYLGPFRDLFGDERPDYARALARYYETGAPVDWQASFISAYATSHPWEDWAETWAHFLHIIDTLEVANDFGLVGKRLLSAPDESDGRSWLSTGRDDFDGVIRAWSELVVALNSINRSMGITDLYPFVLSPPVVGKLRFVHAVAYGDAPPDASGNAVVPQPASAAAKS